MTTPRSWASTIFRDQVAAQRRPDTALQQAVERHIEQKKRAEAVNIDTVDELAEIASEYMDVKTPPKTVRVAKPPAPKPYVPLKYTPSPAVLDGHLGDDLRAYARVAQQVGVMPDELKVELFKDYLRAQTYPTYDLSTVVTFMDAKSRAEGKGWGWKWVPLRQKDHLSKVEWFGTSARRADDSWNELQRPASDHYTRQTRSGESSTYDKVVPLHALQKVAKIEADLSGQLDVKFMVSDYETAPAFRPDPFLLAVIDSPLLQRGEARFVIDVWDEPGFGLEQSLKPGV